jgi:hypothetical protein
MGDTAWKASERILASRLGGRRTGPSGRAGPDVVADWLQVEVKTRRTLPAWLLRALQQARVGCPEYRLPIVILHQVGERHDGDLVVMTLRDFEDWFGAVPEVGSDV